MADSALNLVIDVKDNASPKLNNLTNTLMDNKMQMRQLAMGASYLGMSFVAMGVALDKMDSPLTKTAGNLLTTVGGIMAFIGTASHFIYAITSITKALQGMAIMQGITSALSGPAGWAKLGVGLAVAGGAAYGISRLASSASSGNVTIQNHVNLDGKQIYQSTKRNIILNQQQNRTSGIQ
jgi:hypothetical protein